MRTPLLAALLAAAAVPSAAQTLHPLLLDPGRAADVPRVLPNDNRTPAGALADGVLELRLDVGWADWRVEGDDLAGLRVRAVAETGGPPMVPAPLVRVETGTTIRARVQNTLADSSITVVGFQSRPATEVDRLVVAPGDTGTVTFEAGAPGTYLYRVQVGDGVIADGGEREQLAGAFIVDPVGGSPPDRVFVMNVFSTPIDTALHAHGWLEALSINGLSWPHTERLRPAVGDTLRWRIVNASNRNHPMHLHGFFYDVTSVGGPLHDTTYAPGDRRTVVTETLPEWGTMSMEWTPTRPGNWLFHCHLSFHVAPDLVLPDPSGAPAAMSHMAGLVVGIEVQPGPTDLIEVGEPRRLMVRAEEHPEGAAHPLGFALDPEPPRAEAHRAMPSSVLVLRQYQPTFVTVENHMSIPTGVHWHGLELDSWADGVPGWSASAGRVSPVIGPGEAFTYKLSLMRPGTFIYHTHLDDIHQLTGGLYGALIVLADGDTFDPATDHLYMAGWTAPDGFSFETFIFDGAKLEINGARALPDQHAVVGETHRLRIISIAPGGGVEVRMLHGETAVPLTPIAKDGADLPSNQRVPVEVTPTFFAGETGDFVFTPTAPGTYDLIVGYSPETSWRQRWVVTAD